MIGIRKAQAKTIQVEGKVKIKGKKQKKNIGPEKKKSRNKKVLEMRKGEKY